MSLLLLFHGAAPQNLNRTTSDSLTLADAAVRTYTGYSRTVTDAVTLGNTVARTVALGRAPSDAITLASAIARQVVLSRAISDGLTLSDAATASRTFMRTTADTIHFAERVLETLVYTADALSFSDAATRTILSVRSVSDALTLSDTAPVRGVNLGRTISDSVTAADATTRGLALYRGTWEGAYDNFARADVDGWGIPVSGGPAWQWVVYPSTYANTDGRGNIVASDTTTVRLAFLPWPATTEHDMEVTWTSDKTATGNSQQPRVLPRVLSELIYYRLRVDWKTTGQIELLWEKNNEVAVSVITQSGDLFSRAVTDLLHIRAAAIGTSPTTLQGKAWIDGQPEPGWQLETTDSEAVLQDAGGIGLQFRAATGTSNLPVTASFDDVITTGVLGVDDLATRALGLARSVADSLTITDAAVEAKSKARTVTDALTLADSATRAVTLSRSVADALGISDAALRAGVTTRTVTDALGISDATTRLLAMNRALADALTISDTDVRQILVARSVADALTIADTATRGIGVVRAIADAVVFSDSANRVVVLLRSTSDALNFSDAVLGNTGGLQGVVVLILSGPGVTTSVTGPAVGGGVTGPSLVVSDG